MPLGDFFKGYFGIRPSWMHPLGSAKQFGAMARESDEAAAAGNAGASDGGGGAVVGVVVLFFIAAAIFGGNDKGKQSTPDQNKASASGAAAEVQAKTTNAFSPPDSVSHMEIGEGVTSGTWFAETDREINFYPYAPEDQSARDGEPKKVIQTPVKLPEGAVINDPECNERFCQVNAYNPADKKSLNGIAELKDIAPLRKNALYDLHSNRDTTEYNVGETVTFDEPVRFYPRDGLVNGNVVPGQSNIPAIIDAHQDIEIVSCVEKRNICLVQTTQSSGEAVLGLMYKDILGIKDPDASQDEKNAAQPEQLPENTPPTRSSLATAPASGVAPS